MMNRNKLPSVAEAASCAEHGDGQSSDDKWDTMYRRLEQFHAVHGHSNVPSRYSEDPALGFWGKELTCQLPSLWVRFFLLTTPHMPSIVSTQRRQFRRLNTDAETEQSAFVIHPERKKKLEQLQFQFSAKDPNSLSWEERFKQLKDFVVSSHLLIPLQSKTTANILSLLNALRSSMATPSFPSSGRRIHSSRPGLVVK
jgi:Helicase associated domain